MAVLAAAGPERLLNLPRLCLWSHLLGRPCPACGILRAIAALMRGRWAEAWNHNPLVVPVALAILAVGISAAVQLLRNPGAERDRSAADCGRGIGHA